MASRSLLPCGTPLRLALAAAAGFALVLVMGRMHWVGAFVIATFALLAIGVRKTRVAGFAFSLWVCAFVASALFYPSWYGTWFGIDLGKFIIPLTQVIMFGMGTQLTLGDFKRVLLFPKPVVIGMVLQFSIMPLMGKLSAILFSSNPEVGAGMVLIGACPGGVASNVMTYLARGNVALSVTMTAVSTIMSPVLTPALFKLLAGGYIQVNFVSLMISIVNMILLPVAAGIIVNWILLRAAKVYPEKEHIPFAILRAMPVVSMISICVVLAVIASVARPTLLSGTFVLAIFAGAVMHNGAGYILGYWGARFAGLKDSEARTVSIEVGLQNGGMATGLAMGVLKSPLAALSPAVFGTWMNMSGAVLASWWRGRPPADAVEASSAAEVPAMAAEVGGSSASAG
jgi:BASS family bile acid:Na+ symporter